MGEIWIAIGIAAFGAGMAYMGVHLTMHPPESSAAKWCWKVGFIAMAIALCGLIGWQTKLSLHAQSDLNSRLDRIEKNKPTVTVLPAPVTVNNIPAPSISSTTSPDRKSVV